VLSVLRCTNYEYPFGIFKLSNMIINLNMFITILNIYKTKQVLSSPNSFLDWSSRYDTQLYLAFIYGTTSIDEMPVIEMSILYMLVNVRKYRRGNQKWTIQRNWQHRVHNTKKSKTKTQRTMRWTPLCANKHI
jgi:hypothetical protein